ncbi:MAG: YdiY family protein [Phycisphaerales bacterium JB041]
MSNPIITKRRLLAAIALSAGSAASPTLAADTLDTSPAGYTGTTIQDEEAEAPLGPPDESIFTADNWDGSFSAGLNGSSGNNENFSFRAGFSMKKETLRNAAKFDVSYTYASTDGDASENEVNSHARYDWLIPDSKWRYYVTASYEYDDFQEWDHRITFGPGVGYQLIKNDRTDLLLRLAPVLAVREFGGMDNDWRAEINPGLDFEHKITERQTFTTTLDFYSEIGEFENYRFVGSAGWRIDMDPEAGLFLELGIEDEYDSDPGEGFKKNDFAYYATVGWSF